MIKINEIFFSIQGESSLAGWPTVFVRTSGCNLMCTYCDTTHAYYDGSEMSAAMIVEKVQSFPTTFVCITGGEPLLQQDVLPLMKDLCDLGYTVSLETSGSLPCEGVDSRVKKILDVKTPDSGEGDSFDLENLARLQETDELKFVIGSEQDFNWAEQFITKNSLKNRCLVLYSPSFGIVEEKWLAKKILLEKSSARLQLQLHKYIWPPDARGV